ncbi:PAS domain-containing sensor histidine kinase [Pantoea sp. 18069]|uniref:PAS domain-containing hybrid sensor histidine kinase/response regulator n=1 Tax=Pantoea sp. 18069 TaxID=2681415 RepID=UPI0013586419|nr:PAS domain-containing sensor histidine kinase [Pantoea sp. 18069]
MSRPDLSFLLRKDDPQGLHALMGPEPHDVTPLPWPQEVVEPVAEEPLAALVAELRNYQHELEIQNKVLDYSQAVAESASERFEALFASIPLPLLVLDEHDMVIQANAMAHNAFQPTERDRILVSFMPLVSEAHADRVCEAFMEARERGGSEVHEVVFTISDEVHLCGDLHIACIEIPQKKGPPIAQFLCAVVDQGPLLAERLTLQERNKQLFASERRLESVINSSLDAILCVDNAQRITVFNPTAAALFTCAAEDALGSPLERFLPDAASALEFAALTTQAVLGEMEARTASGKQLAVEVSLAFEQHGGGETTTTVFARDLSSRKKAEAHRSELEAQLRESHKMQAVGTMAGGIAHDFNNIVGAILGNVELARADCPEGSTLLESLLEIEKAGRRARDLVRQILTFSRNEPPKRCAVQAAEVIRDTERLLRVTLPPAIALHSHIAPQLPALLADATQVEQALFNLTTNAVHAIGDARGMVQVTASLALADQRLSDRLGLPLANYVALSVQDNGPGIDAATLQRIFEPFFTTKPVGQGTGLGLAVVHGVMRTHGGAVDVTSTLGEGSRFTLYFPVASGSAPVIAAPIARRPALDAPPADGAAPDGAPRRHVMYVDDDQALVFLVQRLLRRRGYDVSGFTDPREAMAALEAAPAHYDLLVTDYNMPGFCGVDLVRAALATRPGLPVALASGYVTTEIEAEALAAGARALIHKPNDVEELCTTVDQLMNQPLRD